MSSPALIAVLCLVEFARIDTHGPRRGLIHNAL